MCAGRNRAGSLLPLPRRPPTAAAAATLPRCRGGKVPLRFVVMDYDEKMRPDTQAMVDGFNKQPERGRGQAGRAIAGTRATTHC